MTQLTRCIAEICPIRINCLYGGYIDPNNCARCKCPQGYTGVLCGTVQQSYPRNCGGELSASSEWLTLTGPKVAPDQNCYWRIRVILL
jgi:hypothetical protein